MQQLTYTLLLGVALIPGAFANTVTSFALTGNNTVCGATCPEDVRADFTAMPGGTLQIVLSNFADTFFDRQVLTGIQFTFAGAANTLSATVSSQTAPGGLFNVNDATGVFTPVAGALTAWSTQSDLKSYLTLTNLGSAAVGAGGEGIVGSATTGPVNNLSNHDPFVIGTATFVLTGISGLDANTVISGVNFNFGTGLDNYIKGTVVDGGTPSSTPEPGTISMLLGGGLLLLARMRRPHTTR